MSCKWKYRLHRIKEKPSSDDAYYNLCCRADFSGRPVFNLYAGQVPQVIKVGSALLPNLGCLTAGGSDEGGEGSSEPPDHRLRRIERWVLPELADKKLKHSLEQLLSDESRRILGESWEMLYFVTRRELTARAILRSLYREGATRFQPLRRPARKRDWVSKPMRRSDLQRAVRGDFVNAEIFAAALQRLLHQGKIQKTQDDRYLLFNG
ncbi:hypothetical protein MYX75_02260 [Acidobacteria bacterium AH-259-A15]|nr:hypothetical protein [Acidobacteria bacterium AH-259-A15]